MTAHHELVCCSSGSPCLSECLFCDRWQHFKVIDQQSCTWYISQQEAQLLLGWPTHGAESIYLKVKVIELNWVASMISISQAWPCNNPVKVIQSQFVYDSVVTKVMDALSVSRQWWNFLSIGRHPGPRSNHLDNTGHFRFRDLEMTPSRSSEVKFFLRILTFQ